MKKILVTGGSGKAGRATIKTLLENNYDVFNVDLEKSIDDNTPLLVLILKILVRPWKPLHKLMIE